MDDNDPQLIELEQKQKIIAAHPFFILLSSDEIRALAERMEVKKVSPQQIIVEEGGIIDKIYLIAEGEAEVKRKIITIEKSIDLPLAILHAGEAIGLSDEGFFSQQGQRTATVIALTPMLLLEIDLNKFTHFMHSFSRLYPAVKNQAEKMLRITFIKNILPFMNLKITEITELAQYIEPQRFTADSIIFKQGDIGDKIYFLQEGEVLIQHTDNQNKIIDLAQLKSPDIFGENALISSLPRNATAKTLTDSQLLSLNFKYVRKLMRFSPALKQNLQTISQNRRIIKKKRSGNFTTVLKNGEQWLMLKDDASHKYCYLPLGSEEIWKKINGQNSITEIIKATKQNFGNNGDKIVKDILHLLVKANFISVSTLSSNSIFKRILRKLRLTK